ncbi:hypothetical protein PS2_021177 [Malus domestica]
MGSVEMEVRLVEIPELEVPIASRFGNFALVRKGRKTSTLGKDLAKFLLPLLQTREFQLIFLPSSLIF